MKETSREDLLAKRQATRQLDELEEVLTDDLDLDWVDLANIEKIIFAKDDKLASKRFQKSFSAWCFKLQEPTTYRDVVQLQNSIDQLRSDQKQMGEKLTERIEQRIDQRIDKLEKLSLKYSNQLDRLRVDQEHLGAELQKRIDQLGNRLASRLDGLSDATSPPKIIPQALGSGQHAPTLPEGFPPSLDFKEESSRGKENMPNSPLRSCQQVQLPGSAGSPTKYPAPIRVAPFG